jgi:hypothetical protein
MKEVPDLNVVVEARREAWSPAPAVPGSASPTLWPTTPTCAWSTTASSRPQETIATALRKSLSRTFTLGTAVLMTGLVAVAAVLAVVVGL